MTTSAIKIVALIAMLIDHIGYYFYDQFGQWAPMLRLIGRLAFPLFIFAFIWGYYHTKNRRLQLFRLYIFGVLMSIINLVFLYFWQEKTVKFYPKHNIFLNFLFIGIGISILENLKNNWRKSLKILLLAFVSVLLHAIILRVMNWDEMEGKILSGFLPSIFYLEYHFWFVILGVLLYIFRNSKLAISIIMLMFSGWHFLTTSPIEPFQQGVMVVAVIFMLAYNGQKGANLKWLFYAIYPLHIVILYLIFATSL